MGFKFKRIDLTAGSSEFPTGTSESGKVGRSKTILTKCAEALISMNCGWAMDTSKSATVTDYTYLQFDPSPNDAIYPALFMLNTTSNCKLLITYFATEPHWGLRDFSGNDILKVNSGSKHCASGLCLCMIPGGSSSTFGTPNTSTFIPDDATRIVATHITSVDADTLYAAFGGNPSSGYTYSWGIYANEYTIAVSCAKSQTGPGNLGTPVLALGRIIGTLAQSTDTESNSRYGCILFRKSSTAVADSEGLSDVVYDSYRLYNSDGNEHSFVGLSPDKNSAITTWASSAAVCGSVSKTDGSWINGTDGSSYGITIYPVDVFQLSGYVYNSSVNNSSRWVPYVIRCVTSNLASYGVTSNDGMKGYLDTDLFRCALGTYGQTFDNGNFICADGTYNFLIGWDSSNTDSIAG